MGMGVSDERGTPAFAEKRYVPYCLKRATQVLAGRASLANGSNGLGAQLSISTETGSFFRLIDSCITQLKA